LSTNPRRLVLRALARLDRSPEATSQAILRSILGGPDARDLDPRDRGLVTECFYGVVRWRLRLDPLIAHFAKRGLPKDPEVLNILRLGIYQLQFLDRVPDHAAVSTSVTLARKLRGPSVARFVNGVLRGVGRGAPEPPDLAVRWGHPAWMVDEFRKSLGSDEATHSRLEANMTPGPVTLRFHPNTPLDALSGSTVLDADDRIVIPPDTVDTNSVFEGIRTGRWLQQDLASVEVVQVLDPKPGDHVLDLCAGRGVKTSQIATRVGSGGSVVSIDMSSRRLAQAVRLVSNWCPETPVRCVVADASKPLPLNRDIRFDCVLLDAPCTGLGVIRRRPEILWRRRPEDVAKMADLQRRILEQALQWVRPGGRLVYAVCTITAEETADVVKDRATSVCVSSPEDGNKDGFYVARLAL
jgi:16S rRNA (cytosine967-C5)-methyltransferase